MTYSKIRYPKRLVAGGCIGVTAPSSGVQIDKLARLDLVESQLKSHGYLIKEGQCLRGTSKHVSAPKEKRAEDFTNLWNDPTVSGIIPPWGGELLIEILPLIDFELLSKTQDPKWVLGYSDTSTLLFAITIMSGIATAHGPNLMDLLWEQPFESSQTALKALSTAQGESFTQYAYPKHQTKATWFDGDYRDPYNITETSLWKTLDGSNKANLKGRIIGGCLDTLVNLVGTPFGDLNRFKNSFKDDGVVLFLENCEQSPCAVARALWNMRLAGWFDGVKGIVFGRSAAPDAKDSSQLSYREALQGVLGDLNFPVILDADIGHMPPQMLLINGTYANLILQNGRASLTQMLR
jgi:muramoyltetrapeptide carboxypeptidase